MWVFVGIVGKERIEVKLIWIIIVGMDRNGVNFKGILFGLKIRDYRVKVVVGVIVDYLKVEVGINLSGVIVRSGVGGIGVVLWILVIVLYFVICV